MMNSELLLWVTVLSQYPAYVLSDSTKTCVPQRLDVTVTWCNDNCFHTPPNCPASHCICYDNTGELTSPNFPSNYPNHQDTSDTIEVAPGHTIKIQFTHFNLEYNWRCYWDYLIITDGDGSQLLSKTCGRTLPEDITSNTNKVIVTFHSDYSVTRPGYKLSWTAVSTDVQECCKTLNVKGYISGIFQKTEEGHNGRAVYKKGNWCIYYGGHWKVEACDWLYVHKNDNSQGYMWSKINVDCPNEVGRQWRYYSWEGASNSGPIQPSASATCDDCYCGLAKRERRIIGGEETEVNEYPWQVLIYTKRGYTNACVTGEFLCGGSVIGDQWVLTAAHCLALECGLTTAEVEVYLGEHNRKENTEADEIQVNVAEMIRHGQYDAETVDYDFALLKLTDKIDFGSHPHIRPICLPAPGSNNDYNDYVAVVTGWGVTDDGTTSDYLREVDVTVVTNTECNTAYTSTGYSITQQMICAAEANNLGGKDACGGDSGGPMITKETGSSGTVPGQNYELIGVVSWGNGCALKDYPGVYARVTTLMDWIQEKTVGSWMTCPRA